MMRLQYLYLVGLIFLVSHSSCGQSKQKNGANERKHSYTNALINESSPYLLQHAHNPVNWYPWGDAALQKAKKENKLLIISIGYAACHWCHVMEHESFEDTTVARLMNENFISIKVDREERPDVDQVYMTAAQLLTGSGGWPLNAIALPDGRPVYAGTYYPKENWMKMLRYFIDLRKKDPGLLEKQAAEITKGIHETESITFNEGSITFSQAGLDTQFKKLSANIDFKQGGANKAPKFPMPSTWEYLLHYYYITKNPTALKAVKATLDNIAMGGIYDQLGGGFSRYSTDARWHVPHFEKMLYDNAQLVSLYAHAYQVTKDPLYKKVVYETLDFVERELTDPVGAFYSSLDADSDDEEGKFYVWTKAEIENALGVDAALFNDYYNVTARGNWEKGKNILFLSETDTAFAKKNKLTIVELASKLSQAKTKLMNTRGIRVRPGLDDKMLSAWNALMLKGYVDAYRVFGEEKYLKAAIKNADFLVAHSIGADGAMTRNYKNGRSSIHALLDDYAFTISAFIDLYQAGFDEKWLNKANEITNYVLQHFFDEKSGMFFYTHNQHANLISRKMEIADNVIPASNSEMAKNLFLLGHYFAREDYINKSRQMLSNVEKDMQENIFFYANWGSLYAAMVKPLKEVAIVGADAITVRQKLDKAYLPDVIFLGGKTEGSLALLENKLVPGQTTIYVCRNKTCKLPVTTAGSALKQIAD